MSFYQALSFLCSLVLLALTTLTVPIGPGTQNAVYLRLMFYLALGVLANLGSSLCSAAVVILSLISG